MTDIVKQLRASVKHKRTWFSSNLQVVPAKSAEQLAVLCLQAAEVIENYQKREHELMTRLQNAYAQAEQLAENIKP